jgi:nucleoside-diphosphate-sugar epimerase
MRVLVTGNNGYIGTIMVRMLQAEGFDVIGLDSDLFEGCVFGDESITGGIPEVPYLRKDIRDVELSDLKGVDAVAHLCALSNDPLGNLNPKITYEINHEGSVRLAKLAKKAGIERYILSSSCSVYGASTADIVNEGSEVHPVTPYAASKVLAEKSISELADSKFSPTFLRSATAYGLSPMLRFDLVLNNFVAWSFTKGIVLLKSDGSAWRPFVHIRDISRAFIAVLSAPRDLVHNQVFNVGKNEENYRIREVAEIVKQTVPNSKIEYAEGAEPDKRSYRVEFNKIATKLPEFKPEWNVRLGAKQLYEAYKKVGLLVEEFEGPRYRRITHLENSLRSGRLDNTLRQAVPSHETTKV